MKFSCGSCNTGYTVPDEKVRGRRIRIVCKKCGEPIVFEGPKSIPPPEAVPMRSVQQTQLGIALPASTPGVASAAKSATGTPPPVPARSVAPKVPQADTWTVAVTRKDPRKMTVREIVEAFAAKTISEQTLVWRKGMSAWKALFDVPELAAALRKQGHEPPREDLERARTNAPQLSTEFDDENEATRVLGASELSVPPPGPQKPAPSRPEPVAANRETATPQKPVAEASPSADFDEDEATAVIDPDRAQSLLAGTGPGPTRKEAPATLPPPRGAESPGRPESGAQKLLVETADDDTDITRDATSTAAQELLRGSPASPRPSPQEPPKAEPTVIVSEEAKKPDQAFPDVKKDRPSAPPARPVHPVQLAIQNEPTRIVQIKTKSNARSILFGFLVVAVASAAGGFIASRLMAPKAPISAPPTEQ